MSCSDLGPNCSGQTLSRLFLPDIIHNPSLATALMASHLPLPVVDLNIHQGQPDDPGVAQALDRALSGFGFCYVTGHGVPREIINELFQANRQFHAQTETEKQSVQINRYHRGYISDQSSTLVTSSIEKPTGPNHSASFMVMQPVDSAHPLWGSAVFGPNQWPDELGAGFRGVIESYYQAMAELSRYLTRQLARALGHNTNVFDPFFTDPTVFLRLLRYPPIKSPGRVKGYGAAPHTDHGFITLVAQDGRRGLEVRHPDGRWLPIEPRPASFVLNVADILSLWSGGRWPSTPHRVTLGTTERFSAAFFFDPNFDTWVEPLNCPNGSPNHSKSVHYGDYLMARFDRNYAYRHAGTDESAPASEC